MIMHNRLACLIIMLLCAFCDKWCHLVNRQHCMYPYDCVKCLAASVWWCPSNQHILIAVIISVVTDSESATESTDSFRVCPSPNPQFFVAISDGFGSSVRKSVFTCQVAPFKWRCITVCGHRCGHVGDWTNAPPPPPPLSGQSHLFRHTSLRSFK